MSAPRRSGLAAVAAALLAAACTDTSANPFDTSNAVASSSSSSSSGGSRSGASATSLAIVACPSSSPPAGATCSWSGLVCELGKDVDPRCNPHAECDGYHWWPREPDAACEPKACPAARSTIEVGAACTPPGDGRDELLCAYPGELCGCTDVGGRFAWRCVPSDPGCPATRPRIGAACDSPRSCDYGACAFANGLRLECTDASPSPYASGSSFGVWLVREPACSSSPETSP